MHFRQELTEFNYADTEQSRSALTEPDNDTLNTF